MKKIISILGLFTFLMLTQQVKACDENGITGFVEDVDMEHMFSMEKSDIDKEEFDRILDKVGEIYTPIIKEKGGNLNIVRLWDSETLNAYAQRSGKTWKISMYGGLARHVSFTSDGFALVACHEIGHHIGGAPKKKSFFGIGAWASNEGQADYWGNAKCMRRYMLEDDNMTIVSEMEVDEFAKTQCEASFKGFDDNEIAMCIRGAMAGKSLARFFQMARKSPVEPKFDTPDTNVVTRTNHSHPAAQCRMDTYFQGALCNMDYDVDVSQSDAKEGVCNRSDDMELGVRPKCWYKPAASML